MTTGIPQRVLAARYSSAEITELLALKFIQLKENDKQDIRFATLTKAMEKFHGYTSKSDYIPKWYDEKTINELNRIAAMTPYERGMEEKRKWMRL